MKSFVITNNIEAPKVKVLVCTNFSDAPKVKSLVNVCCNAAPKVNVLNSVDDSNNTFWGSQWHVIDRLKNQGRQKRRHLFDAN